MSKFELGVDNSKPLTIEIGTPKTRVAKEIRAALSRLGWGRGYRKDVRCAVDGDDSWNGEFIKIDDFAEYISKNEGTTDDYPEMMTGVYCINLYGAGCYGELEDWFAVEVVAKGTKDGAQ